MIDCFGATVMKIVTAQSFILVTAYIAVITSVQIIRAFTISYLEEKYQKAFLDPIGSLAPTLLIINNIQFC